MSLSVFKNRQKITLSTCNFKQLSISWHGTSHWNVAIFHQNEILRCLCCRVGTSWPLIKPLWLLVFEDIHKFLSIYKEKQLCATRLLWQLLNYFRNTPSTFLAFHLADQQYEWHLKSYTHENTTPDCEFVILTLCRQHISPSYFCFTDTTSSQSSALFL